MPDLFDDETVCVRCGRCCYEKFRAEEHGVVFTDIPCRFLDTGTRLCTVYPERFVRQPRCSSARRSASLGGLPRDCPYVAGDPDYPRTHSLNDLPHLRPLLEELFPESAAAGQGMGRPEGKKHKKRRR